MIDAEKSKAIEREHLDSLLSNYNSHNFFNKYGFMDGEEIIEGEKKILRELLNNIVKKAPKFGRFYLSVISTASHNPYYIAFVDENEEKENQTSLKPFRTSHRLDDFSKIEQINIEKEMEPVIKQEIEKMRKKWLPSFPISCVIQEDKFSNR